MTKVNLKKEKTKRFFISVLPYKEYNQGIEIDLKTGKISNYLILKLNNLKFSIFETSISKMGAKSNDEFIAHIVKNLKMVEI